MRKLTGVSVRLSEEQMEKKLLLGVFSLMVQVSLAAVQHVTVMQGDPVSLTCFLNNLHHAHVEWKNPEGHILFYNAREAKRDIRIRITTLSQSEFSIRITSVTFKDGGNYTCTQYDDNGAFEQIVEVTVLGQPRISTVKHGKVNVVKCRVEGNHHPPQISWILSNGPEFSVHSTIYRDGHTFVSEGSLGVHHVRNRVMVKCLVHHPALYSPPLLAFIKLGQRQKRPGPPTLIRVPTAHPGGQRTAAGDFTTTIMNVFSSEESTLSSSLSFSSSDPKYETVTPSLHLEPVTSSGSRRSTRDLMPVSETTVDTLFNKTVETNHTESSDSNMQVGAERTSSLLVLLVTTLIFGLLVVVVFFAIKLRRAHMAWKRENDDSDPSEESSKSKSVPEDKNSQGQRRRGLFNTAFTQYVVEEPPIMTSVVNTNAATPKDPAPQQTASRSHIKETSL
ncbi:cytotoxic and regulatory T-cell molecule isoform X4 [Nothobranchius furzeri]|uniref:Cytotoxic and regulatory T-cell molecule n=1 Tax=Nothobranchius furzeri TaxID=105023 RepID=A0A9D2XP57_NOTFU|nr:cytotoxic and regulatory T-cell molecule isoform X4 [Nothobranchius furzeri]KAF7205680.1 cytotoxic and regulatory T-cell molecule [Nothobranchius furzeri]